MGVVFILDFAEGQQPKVDPIAPYYTGLSGICRGILLVKFQQLATHTETSDTTMLALRYQVLLKSMLITCACCYRFIE
jgi:hypothetical protein